MPSSPTPRNRIEKQNTGENVNTWGDKLNQTGLELLDEALDGVEPIAIASTAVVLTSVNYGTDQARNRALVLTGTLTGNTTVTVPSVEKVYLVVDNTTRAGFTLTLKTSGGAGYALRPGPQWAFSDGVDVFRGQPRMDQLPLPTGPVDMNGQRLTNLPTPSANTDSATKKYVDDAAFATVAGQLPGQAGNANRVLTTDGSVAGWGPLLPNTTASDKRKVPAGSAAGGGFDLTQMKEPLWGGTAGGTPNALTASTGLGLTSLTAGMIVGVQVGATANNGAATLAVDSVPPVAIRKDGGALVGGELAASTDRYFMYDGTYLRLMSGVGGGAFSDIVPVTGAGTIGASSMGKLVKATGGSYTLTLAAAATLGKGSLGVKNAGGTSDVVTVANSSGVALAVLSSGQATIIACDGTNVEAVNAGYVNPVILFSTSDKASNITVSTDGKTASMASGSVGLIRATSTLAPALAVFGFKVNSGSMSLGVAIAAASLAAGLGVNANGWGYDSGSGTKNWNGVSSAYGATLTAGDIVHIYVNRTTGAIWWAKNGVVQGAGDPATGANPAFTGLPASVYPAVGLIPGASVTLLITAGELVYATAAGYSPLG